MVNKLYIVKEFGGQYEDRWELVAAVCETRELAETLKKKILDRHNIELCPISNVEWIEMSDALCKYEDDMHFDNYVEGMLQLFPQYSQEDIQMAEDIYDNPTDWIGVDVLAVYFIKNINDINDFNC